MKIFLTAILFCLVPSRLFPQNASGGFTVLMGGSVGKFNVNGGGNFNSIYSDRKLAYTGTFGLGDGETFLIGKYRIFSASGQSKLTNIDATGTAQWNQKILLAGLRVHPGGSALYLDVLYLFNHAEETIGTVNPSVNALSASQTIDNNGFALGLGLTPKIAGPIDLDMEVEYSATPQKLTNNNTETIPNLGGIYFGGGLIFYF